MRIRAQRIPVLAVAIGLVSSLQLAPPPAAAAPESAPAPIGAFLGSDSRGVARISDFEQWLGGPEITVGHTYLAGNDWSDIEGPDWVLEPWSAWRSAKPERMLVLNVPMLVPNEVWHSDAAVAGLLQRGARGEFNDHFRVLAHRLVAKGAADTVLVPGWEMNGITYTSRCEPDPTAWKAYWRQIVTTMRDVPGQRFRFDFTPSRGVDAIPWTRCYPGDDVVDIIGMDTYDQAPGATFAEMVSQPYGLQAQADFAAAHGKPISFPEWGMFRRGDNPDFVQGMYDWIAAHDVAYQTITDYCPHGVFGCADNPQASATYRRLFGAASGSSPAVPAPVIGTALTITR